MKRNILVCFLLAAMVAFCQSTFTAVTGNFTNDAATGTVQGGLVSFGSLQRVVETASGATFGAIGICHANCGVDGAVQVTLAGVDLCRFDGATTLGDWVQIGASGYQCHDTGSSTPPSSGGQVIGLVMSTNAGAGIYNVLLQLGSSGGGAYTPLVLPSTSYSAYGLPYPAAASGTPTLAQCQAVVAALASSVAQYAMNYSVVLSNSYATTVSGKSSGYTATVNGHTGNLAALTTVSQSIPVDVVAANPNLSTSLSANLGWQVAEQVDAALLNLYAGFVSYAPIGTGGTPLIDYESFPTILSDLPATGEPITLVVDQVQAAHLIQNSADGTESHWMLSGRPARFNNSAWTGPNNLLVLSSDQIQYTGSDPVTTHNLAFTPSAMAFVSNIATPSNSGTVAQAVSTFNGFSVLISITNSGSGNQTISVTVLGVAILTKAANGVQVNS